MSGLDLVRLELELEDFETGSFAMAPPPGVRVITLAELGDDDRQRRRIYELNQECAVDIPHRGQFFSWAAYRRARFEGPQCRADGQILALAGEELVGLCQVSRRAGVDWAFVEMTGVRRTWRRRGVATALKLAAIDTARGWGAARLRTVHHPDNTVIIAANRKLGFGDADFTLPV